MAYFMCQYCGYLVNLGLDVDVPPHKCPVCDQPCAFVNVTCYTPECGGESNLDPRIIACVLRTAARHKMNTRAGLVQRSSVSSDSDALCREAALLALCKLRDQILSGYLNIGGIVAAIEDAQERRVADEKKAREVTVQ